MHVAMSVPDRASSLQVSDMPHTCRVVVLQGAAQA